MPNYKRIYAGNLWFFTVVTHKRLPFLITGGARKYLREAIKDCQARYPFEIDAWVLLPDHLHCIWELPEIDRDYSRRWSIIKRKFTKNLSKGQNMLAPFWQNRFWAHLITDDLDYEHHVNYVHFNPVKHGLVKTPEAWPWTSFHRWAAGGKYPPGWGEQLDIPAKIGQE
jgi:putative transposase